MNSGQDVTVYAGEDKTILVKVTKESDGTPVILDGGTLKWALAESDTSEKPVLTKTTDDGITILNQDQNPGQMQISIVGAEDTLGLPARTYYHECSLTDSVGKTSVIFKGQFIIKRSITLIPVGE